LYLLLPVLSRHVGHLVGASLLDLFCFHRLVALSYSGKVTEAFPFTKAVTANGIENSGLGGILPNPISTTWLSATNPIVSYIKSPNIIVSSHLTPSNLGRVVTTKLGKVVVPLKGRGDCGGDQGASSVARSQKLSKKAYLDGRPLGNTGRREPVSIYQCGP